MQLVYKVIPFSASGRILQEELLKLNLATLASRVVVDTVPYTSYIGDVQHYSGITKAVQTLSSGNLIVFSIRLYFANC